MSRFEYPRLPRRDIKRRKKMSTFKYPRLPREDIIGQLSDYGIATVSEADLSLSNPNPHSISKLYTLLLIYLDHLQGEDDGLNLIEFPNLEYLDNAELHADFVRFKTLFHKISEVISALECPKKFTLRDLFMPKPEHTECFLSAILNFCLHKDTQMNELEPFVDEISELDEERRVLEGRISELTLELSEFNESREREMPLIQEVETKIKEMRQSISALNKHQVSLKESIKKKKDTSREIDEEISSAEFAFAQRAQENASLHSEIVQSPVKLQRALEEKTAVLVEAKNAERASRQSYEKQSAFLEIHTKAYKKMTKHLKQMQTLQAQVNSAKQVEKDVKVLKVKNSDDGLLDKSLEAKLFELQGRADQLEELQKLMEKESDASCEEASKEFNNVKSKVEFDLRGLEQRRRNVETLVEEAAAINETINKGKDLAAAEQQMLLRKAEEITKAFFNHSNSTGRVISQIEALTAEAT